MKIQRISGIQKKYLINIVLLLALALLLSSVGVGIYVRKNMSNVVLDKYEFMTEKMGITLDGLYKKSEEVTAECITDKTVQKSLQATELELGEKNALSKYFAYTDLDYVSEYCYVDNKENVYTKSYSDLSYKDFKKSGIEKKLSSNYAETQWFFGKIHCSIRAGRNCLSDVMYAIWRMYMLRGCCFLKWMRSIWEVSWKNRKE